jgi:hypothetical protein
MTRKVTIGSDIWAWQTTLKWTKAHWYYFQKETRKREMKLKTPKGDRIVWSSDKNKKNLARYPPPYWFATPDGNVNCGLDST